MTKKMTVIGLTGSIGMGKSETAKMFGQENIPIFDSDGAVHILMGKDGAATQKIAAAFPGVMGPCGIDRQKLGSRVFGHGAALKKLEAILHPMVTEMRQKFFQKATDQGADMAVMDVPLLFETGAEAICDYTVVVSAPAEIQRARVLARPNMTVKKFEHILSQQMPDGEKRQRADFIVLSDQGKEKAKAQVRQIIRQIRMCQNQKDKN